MCRRATELSQIQDAFNPQPLITEEELRKYYLETSQARTGDKYSDFVRTLSLQLEDSTEACLHKLFIGHPGSGKTTELYQLLHSAQNRGFVACLGRCDIELDSADVDYTDVLFFVLDLLVNEADRQNIALKPKLIDEIREYWEEDTEITELVATQAEVEVQGGADGKAGIGKLLSIFAQIKGVIKNSSDSRVQIRRHIEPNSSELIRMIQNVIDAFAAECKEIGKKAIPLIILDGLDKIPLEQARKIFRENGSRFSALKVHLIVTFPIALTYTPEYSDILTWFPNPEKLPMIKLKKWEDGHYDERYQAGTDAMRKIVEKRAELSLFNRGVLSLLIKQTGGYIRDLFRCISGAAVRARLRGAKTISMSDAQVALNNLESDINGRYSDEMIPVMDRIFKGEKYLTSSDEMTKLLQIGAVLEYNGKRWCDLHPLVEKWLIEHKKIGN